MRIELLCFVFSEDDHTSYTYFRIIFNEKFIGSNRKKVFIAVQTQGDH